MKQQITISLKKKKSLIISEVSTQHLHRKSASTDCNKTFALLASNAQQRSLKYAFMVFCTIPVFVAKSFSLTL